MKYNDNGEYKDIYVKAFDTLPVGAEVNMPDGSTVPSGWEEVSENYITTTYSLGGKTISANSGLELGGVPSNNNRTWIGTFIKSGVSIQGMPSIIVEEISKKIYLYTSVAQTFNSNAKIILTHLYR